MVQKWSFTKKSVCERPFLYEVHIRYMQYALWSVFLTTVEWNSRGHWKWFLSSNSKSSADIFTPNISKDALMQAGSEAAFNFWRQWLLYCKVSCLFTKHILPCSFVTVYGTEILHTPKRRSSIARHSIPSTFFCWSAVCLLISQNVNKKMIGIFRSTFLDSKPTKNNFSW